MPAFIVHPRLPLLSGVEIESTAVVGLESHLGRALKGERVPPEGYSLNMIFLQFGNFM